MRFIWFVLMIVFPNVVCSQSAEDILAFIKDDSLFLYNVDNENKSFIAVLPAEGKCHFEYVNYHSNVSDVCLICGDTSIIYKLSANTLISSLTSIRKHDIYKPFYTLNADVWQNNGTNRELFIKARINKKASLKNVQRYNDRLYNDIIPLIGKSLPRNAQEEYNVCDLSPDGGKILVLYCITKDSGRRHCMIPISCEIDIATKSMRKTKFQGYNAKYSPSGRYYIYYQSKRFGKQLSSGFCLYDAVKDNSVYLDGIEDAVWINRNINVILSSKMYYIYMSNLFK